MGKQDPVVRAGDQSLQEDRLRAERLSTIGRMAALLAHEIRTPLTSIGGFARRLVRSTPPEDPRREELEIIVAEVSRLERMVDEILGYHRVTRTAFAPVDTNTLVSSLLQTLDDELRERRIVVVREFDAGLPAIQADASQLRQVLINLIVNAMEAMPDGGTLTLTTCREGDFAEICVADTGVGVPVEQQERLFTPFFTTKATGTGLGLPVVAQVVENHGGSVGFESDPGSGTRFHVRLPVGTV